MNHFEFEPEISNKKYMFANILENCDVKIKDFFINFILNIEK